MAGGRPTKLTPEIQKKLCDSLSEGLTITASCGRAGIGLSTYYLWQDHAKKAKRKNRFTEFMDAVDGAMLLGRSVMEVRFANGTKMDWRAAKEYLARRYPDEWGEKTKHEVSGGITVVRTATPRPPQIEQTEESDGT